MFGLGIKNKKIKNDFFRMDFLHKEILEVYIFSWDFIPKILKPNI
jgi:hypothetical protein